MAEISISDTRNHSEPAPRSTNYFYEFTRVYFRDRDFLSRDFHTKSHCIPRRIIMPEKIDIEASRKKTYYVKSQSVFRFLSSFSFIAFKIAFEKFRSSLYCHVIDYHLLIKFIGIEPSSIIS